jgi:ABC-type multidrug transport system ATPase subunit
MSEPMAITARGLTKRYRRAVWTGMRRSYREITAVKNLDLDIPAGTIYGFLGPNGAGKTTTIRMLLGLVQPSSGDATVLGHDIRRERPAIARRVGAVVEVPSFYPYLNGAENLLVLGRSSNLDITPGQIQELLTRVGLGGRERDQVKSYSLGMKQRLGIAATLLSNPQIIFLDEPTNGLDPAGTVEVRNLIRQLGQEGRTVFLSSHLLGEVEQVCSDVAIIQEGLMRRQGKVSELLGTTSMFALELAPAERALALLAQHPQLQATVENGHWVRVTATPDDIPPLVRALVAAEVDVYQVQAQRNSLEKLFLELTQTGPAEQNGGRN